LINNKQGIAKVNKLTRRIKIICERVSIIFMLACTASFIYIFHYAYFLSDNYIVSVGINAYNEALPELIIIIFGLICMSIWLGIRIYEVRKWEYV
jgi:hypothetical protein